MASTRKQKARGKRSRLSDVMSDLENVDIMLDSYSRGELKNHQNEDDIEVELEYDRLQRNTFRQLGISDHY